MTTSTLTAARDAAARYAWHEALDLFKDADTAGALGPDDLALLAESTWWMGRVRDSIAARERAHAGYLAASDPASAAIQAARLVEGHLDLGEHSLVETWSQRAGALLDGLPEGRAHAHVAFVRAYVAGHGDDPDRAFQAIDEAIAIAQRHGERDLVALALSLRGVILAMTGSVEEGMRLLEEATVPAVGGELGPLATGWIYCMMISACSGTADWQRAGQWTDAAKRWCDRQTISGFPGVCRVHRAEILRLRGSLDEAIEEARTATVELGSFNIGIAAQAFRELGEIRLRMGELDEADAAFRQANELGVMPQPGLAQIQLRRGKVDAAAAALRRALAEPLPPFERAKLLPVHAEVAIRLGDLTAARDATDELGGLAALTGTAGMRAVHRATEAALHLAEGDLVAAESAAKEARKLWREIDVLYEAARCCLLLGDILRAQGDTGSAEFEYETALSTFDRFGAVLDAQDVRGRLASLAGAPPPKRVAKTFLFSDIVRSTDLAGVLGDEAWTDLLTWHDEMMRARFTAHGGVEVVHTGDGFFVAFDGADEAIACAIDIQRTLAEHRRSAGFAPQVRIGLHAADATEIDGNYHGMGVHEAARIGALAEGGEILASATTAECVAGSGALGEAREVTLKGVREPVRIVPVEWRAG